MPTKRICAVPNCGNGSKQGWTLFSIPKEEAVRQVWCERVGLNVSNLKSKPLLCQLHFSEDDLVMSANSFRLRPGAVPNGPDISPEESSDTASSQSLSSPKLSPRKEQRELTSMKMLQAKRKLQLMQNFTPSPPSDASRRSQLSADDLTYRASDNEENMTNVKKRRLSIIPDRSRNFIVNEFQLMKLPRRCPNCGGSSGVDIAPECFGVDVKYSIACSHVAFQHAQNDLAKEKQKLRAELDSEFRRHISAVAENIHVEYNKQMKIFQDQLNEKDRQISNLQAERKKFQCEIDGLNQEMVKMERRRQRVIEAVVPEKIRAEYNKQNAKEIAKEKQKLCAEMEAKLDRFLTTITEQSHAQHNKQLRVIQDQSDRKDRQISNLQETNKNFTTSTN